MSIDFHEVLNAGFVRRQPDLYADSFARCLPADGNFQRVRGQRSHLSLSGRDRAVYIRPPAVYVVGGTPGRGGVPLAVRLTRQNPMFSASLLVTPRMSFSTVRPRRRRVTRLTAWRRRRRADRLTAPFLSHGPQTQE